MLCIVMDYAEGNLFKNINYIKKVVIWKKEFKIKQIHISQKK